MKSAAGAVVFVLILAGCKSQSVAASNAPVTAPSPAAVSTSAAPTPSSTPASTAHPTDSNGNFIATDPPATDSSASRLASIAAGLAAVQASLNALSAAPSASASFSVLNPAGVVCQELAEALGEAQTDGITADVRARAVQAANDATGFSWATDLLLPTLDPTVASLTGAVNTCAAHGVGDPVKPTKPKPKPVGTVAQQNAIKAAKSYLAIDAFSRKGLIEQLSSSAGDGYSKADATFAVDHIVVDYNAQAVKAAEQYLSIDSFSRSGLIDQLSSSAGDGYTLAQARFAVTKVGL